MDRIILSLILLLLLAGCNEDKVFLTPTSDTAIIDISHKDIFFNGEKIGEPIKDIEQERNSLTIKPLEKRLKGLNPKPSTIHIHIADINSFSILTHTFMSVLIRGFDKIEIALGNEFKNTISPYMFKNERDNNHPCRGAKGAIRELINNKMEEGMTADEKYQKRLNELERDRECAENFIELNFTYFNDKGSISFEIDLNEIGVIGTNKHTKFDNEKELWKYIEELRSRDNLQNKIDKDEIMFIAKGNVKLNEIAPFLIRLSQMGYNIKFATMS